MSVYKTELGFDGRFVYQDTEDYAFSQDSVFLANLAKITKGESVVDLGSGSGILDVLIALKRDVNCVVGVEIKEAACGLAKRSVEENGLTDKISYVCADVKDAAKIIGCAKFDKAVCNPPYFENEHRNKHPDDGFCSDINILFSTGAKSLRGVARTENSATLADFIIAAKKLIRFGGELTIIQKHNRLCELLRLLSENNLEPKHIIYVIPKPNASVDTVIVRARLGGKIGLTSEIFYVLNADGTYTERYNEISNQP